MSVPFYGEEFEFTQPDGTTLRVKGWGDQHHAVFETLDGFTVVEDPITGFYSYAALSSDHERLESTSVRIGVADPTRLGLSPSVRITGESAKALAATRFGGLKRRCETRRERRLLPLRASAIADAPVPAPPSAGTTGQYVGLCLLVEFPDVPAQIGQGEVERFCNEEGYNGFGNNGSVYDYFYDNSREKLEYKNIVAAYYTAKHKLSYYTDERIPQPFRTYELIKEALAHLTAQGFDPAELSADDEGFVYALNVYYAGTRTNNWAKGLWPHSYRLDVPYQLGPNRRLLDYQITDMGEELTLGTFCHENGHMVCDFPDLYDYGYQSFGVGVYCLMSGGGGNSPKNPSEICAYLKYKAGWAGNVTTLHSGMNVTFARDKNDFCLYQKNDAEYFILEVRDKADRDASLPASGLAIWHVDELGSNDNEQRTQWSHYECSLEQADGRFDLEEKINKGDKTDLFVSGVNSAFGHATSPSSDWWNGQSSGLEITDISSPGHEMKFSVK